MLENMDTIVVLSVKTRRSRSATSIPMRTLARSPRQLAKRLLTPSISRSARRSSTLFVRKLTSSIITVSMLLGMNQMLLLDLLAFMKNTRVKAMVMDTKEGIRFYILLCLKYRNYVAGHESNVVAGSAGFHEEHKGESYGHGHQGG